jgi:hypothetical protein
MIAAIINLVVIFILFLDSFWIPPYQEQHTVDSFEKKHVRTGSLHGGGGSGFDVYILTSVSGNQFEVSEQSSETLQPGDIFTAARSRLFKRNLKISYQTTSGNYTENIGKLNNSQMILGSYILIAMVSLWVLLLCYQNKRVYKNLHSYLHILALMLSFFNLIIYFS